MSRKDWQGGIIRPVPVPPTGPYEDGAASGVWTLQDVADYLKQGLWPIAGNIDTSNRGVFAGGNTGSTANTIDYINITTTGNASDFGDLYLGVAHHGACSSSTRGIFGGGTAGSRTNVIQYITIASTGNSSDFGDMANSYVGDHVISNLSACSNDTRGVFGGGYTDYGTVSSLQYVTIASTGNTLEFGDLTQATQDSGSCSSTTRGVWGGNATGNNNVISYITIATTGNATDFGDLLSAGNSAPTAGCSNSTRGLFIGGYSSNVINYITIASTGNATDFGDMLYNPGAFGSIGACASDVRATFGGGYVTTYLNNINYVTIATTGNATDFGDLTEARLGLSACSNAHGGLA